jgi:dipeptide/tripeptide permease
MGPHDATAVKQFVSYARLPKSPTEKLDTSSDNNLVAPSPKPSGVIQILKDSFKSLDSCPRELWINFVLKFFESYSYFAISQILVIYLHTEFGVGDIEAGVAYGSWGLAITLWGLLTAWINDNLGVRRSLLVGFSLSAIGFLFLAIARTKVQVYIVIFGILPLGNSMGIPMLTVGIKRYTNILNRGFAFGLFYSVMNIAAFISGPVIDIFNIYFNHGKGKFFLAIYRF